MSLYPGANILFSSSVVQLQALFLFRKKNHKILKGKYKEKLSKGRDRSLLCTSFALINALCSHSTYARWLLLHPDSCRFPPLTSTCALMFQSSPSLSLSSSPLMFTCMCVWVFLKVSPFFCCFFAFGFSVLDLTMPSKASCRL